MINGSTTNNASDGMVNTMLAVTVVSRLSTVVRCTSAPNGTAITRPSTIGISDSRRWMSVSAHRSSRWVNRYRTGSAVPPLRIERRDHVVGLHPADHLPAAVDGHTESRG